MYRVVTKWLDHGQWITEAGPWLSSYSEAEGWAKQFREMGYQAALQNSSAAIHGPGNHADQSAPLTSMA